MAQSVRIIKEMRNECFFHNSKCRNHQEYPYYNACRDKTNFYVQKQYDIPGHISLHTIGPNMEWGRKQTCSNIEYNRGKPIKTDFPFIQAIPLVIQMKKNFFKKNFFMIQYKNGTSTVLNCTTIPYQYQKVSVGSSQAYTTIKIYQEIFIKKAKTK